MKITLNQGTNRNTKAYVVTINEHELFFSYSTCIAYRGPLGHFRLDNTWGPTTGRHINEMGLRNLPIVTEKEMETTLSSI